MQPNEIRTKIFGLYPDCDVQYGNHVYKVVSVNFEDQNLALRSSTGIIDTVSSNGTAQLILTDLSEITDEDAKEAANILGISYDNNPTAEAEFDLPGLVDYIKSLFLYDAIYHNLHQLLGLTDFLRSRGYMLPAYGIENLFEAEIAVRKQKEV